MSSTPFKISPAKVEDAVGLARVSYLAYQNNKFTPILQPDTVTEEEQVAFYAGGLRKGIEMAGTEMGKKIGLGFVKVVVGELIVGNGVWIIPVVGSGEKGEKVDEEKRDAEKSDGKKAESPNWPAGENAGRLMGDLAKGSREFKHNLIGPYGAEMNSLSVHPDYQRKGIGKMLLDWGLAKIDTAGSKAFVESTLEAKGLYEKCGFKVVKEVLTELREYGGEGQLESFYMVRGVHGADVGDLFS